VRQRLGFQIVADIQELDGALPLIQLSPDWEETFNEFTIEIPGGSGDVALPPDEFNRLANSIAERLANVSETGRYAAVVTSMKRRRFLNTILKSKGIRNPVLSFEEIGIHAKPALLGTA